jgi:hypothetical protein
MSVVYVDVFNVLTRKAKRDDKPAYFKKLILSYLYTLDDDDEGYTLKKLVCRLEPCGNGKARRRQVVAKVQQSEPWREGGKSSAVCAGVDRVHVRTHEDNVKAGRLPNPS